MKNMKRKIAKLLLGASVALAATAVSALADTWQRAEIYFTDWDVLTRERCTIAAARDRAQHKMTITKDAARFAEILALQKLKPVKEKKPEDARLVVDLYTDTNSKVTYYASRQRISTADDTMKLEADRSFREKIRGLFK